MLLTLCWAFHRLFLLVRVSVPAVMAIHIILKKKLWFSELSAKMSDSCFNRVQLSKKAASYPANSYIAQHPLHPDMAL